MGPRPELVPGQKSHSGKLRILIAVLDHLGQMPKPLSGCEPPEVNDKGRSHQQSQDPFSRGIEFRADAAHSRRLRIFLRRLRLGKFGRLRSRAKLAIASIIIHDLDWRAANNFGSFAPYTDYPLTGLVPRNAPTGISRP